ncbi:hypothetical protein BDV97DRAFT_394679 [Delphinella strobiligena]|nr:hypothetical protein BDV97DRAFT_394679 [Delphinella strobiligena]
MAVTDESEWEYEYDEHESEDFYITLDMTTHVPPSLAQEKKNRASKGGRKSNKSLANAPGRTGTQSANTTQGQEEADTSQPQPTCTERMQIVDLDGDQPLISFNNALYSCKWATDVGTSLYITPPPAEADAHHPPLRSTPFFDLLGTGFARLIAVPAAIKPRTAPLSPVNVDQPASDKLSFSTAEGDIIHADSNQGLRIQLPSTASSLKVNQARFLERLSAIKAKRGDRDAVPISNVKYYKLPDGWEAEKEEWIAKETALSERNRLEAELRMAKSAGRVNRFTSDHDIQRPMYHVQGTPGPEDLSEQDLDSADPDATLSSELNPRKRMTRGGPRGGAPSGKKLRQSLGLPEARRDKRPNGRPRQIRLDSEFTDQGHDTLPGATSQHGSVEASGANETPEQS